MVTFINADLINRASLDVRRSVVFYDEACVFEYATAELPDAGTLEALAARTACRFWSKGLGL